MKVKVEKGISPTRTREKTVPLHVPSGLFQAQEKNRKNAVKLVKELDYQQESVIHLCFCQARQALLVHPLLQ